MIDRREIDYGGRLEHSIGLDNWPRLYGNRLYRNQRFR